MKKRYFAFIFCSLISITHASDIIDRPIAHHLKEAIKLNLERYDQYAKLTDGKSKSVTSSLITFERLALLFTYNLDTKARAYHEHDIAIFHEDMVDMKLTPAFRGFYDKEEVPRKRVSIPMKEMKKNWKKLLKEKKHDELYQAVFFELENGLLKEKNQNCLSRHFAESIARGLLLSKKYQQQAIEENLKDPTSLTDKFLNYQIASLGWAYNLDKRAYSIQEKGVSVLCDDVPPITYK